MIFFPRASRLVRWNVVFFLLLISRLFAESRYDNLVDIRSVDPTIVVELRYATVDNITGRRLYPREMPALVRPSTAARLAKAQALLRPLGYRLKIWDAYRPL